MIRRTQDPENQDGYHFSEVSNLHKGPGQRRPFYRVEVGRRQACRALALYQAV